MRREEKDRPGAGSEKKVEVLNYLPPEIKHWEKRTTFVDWKRRGKRS